MQLRVKHTLLVASTGKVGENWAN